MSDGIREDIEAVIKKLAAIKKPEAAEASSKLKRYCDEEKKALGVVGAMREKASGMVVYGLNLKQWADENTGPEANAFKKHAGLLAAATDALEALSDALDGVIEGTPSAKVKLPGGDLQKLTDALQFKDNVQVAELHKAALAYYPAESAGKKKLDEWSVRLGQVIPVLKEAGSLIGAADKGVALKRATELKKKIDGLGF